MSDSFGDREKGFETKFKLDQEAEFKVEARRNKLLGIWLAEKLGISDSGAEEYANTLVVVDMQEPGFEDVIRKCLADIEKHGANVSEQGLRQKIEEFHTEAHIQILGE